MISNSMRCTLFGGAVIALAGFTSLPVVAAALETSGAVEPVDGGRVVIAQATGASVALAPRDVTPNDAFPAYQRGVREAAAQSNEALRRYIWRTRMIYDFYYPDFASGE
ncbi:MAG TPA: hypothetical protein VFO53_02260 [Casimicrobiaceae bacterium]|nr:hypothetical protein [Casimicrobiaceae bacterium]